MERIGHKVLATANIMLHNTILYVYILNQCRISSFCYERYNYNIIHTHYYIFLLPMYAYIGILIFFLFITKTYIHVTQYF
jgi:hypothetical protein